MSVAVADKKYRSLSEEERKEARSKALTWSSMQTDGIVKVPQSLATSTTPYVKITSIVEEFAYWDGILSGLCTIEDSQQVFLFCPLVESIWRSYENGNRSCPYRIWGVFAATPADIGRYMNAVAGISDETVDECIAVMDCIGITW